MKDEMHPPTVSTTHRTPFPSSSSYTVLVTQPGPGAQLGHAYHPLREAQAWRKVGAPHQLPCDEFQGLDSDSWCCNFTSPVLQLGCDGSPSAGGALMVHVWVTSPAQAHGHVSTPRKPLLPSPASRDVYATMVLSCAEELGVAYMMEQVKPQHSLSRVRPVLVTYGAEVCWPREVIFFSLAGAVERGINVRLMVRAQAHRCFLELFPGLRC